MLTFLPPISPSLRRHCLSKCQVPPRRSYSRRARFCATLDTPQRTSHNGRTSPSNTTRTSYDTVLNSVLKLYVTHTEPNYELPWSMTPQRHSTSSAFILHPRTILTNAHSVEHHTCVRVKKRQSDTKYDAVVVAVGNECDIALLHVENEQFWTDIEGGLHPGDLPTLQDAVLVVGYPSPGNQISVTAGVTSRVEMQQYVHGQGELLAVQIDAAINPGNSGGPVVNDDHEVVGIAFQSVDPSQADSVGYFIPFCVVQHFLDDIETNQRYTGFPYSGFRSQRMENAHLRRALGLEPDASGILVKWVAETSDAARVLKKGDIVTHIDGISISNAGTVPFRYGERIGLEFLVTSKFAGDTVNVTFFRDGIKCDANYKMPAMADHRLVPVHDANHLVRRQPEYVIYGGLVFQSLSEPYLRTVFGENWLYEAPVRLIEEYYRGTKTKAGRTEVVLLAQILATATTAGYEEENASDITIVNKINGVAINNLRHLATVIDSCDAHVTDLRFELDEDAIIIIDRMQAVKEEAHVLGIHCIPAPRSLGKDAAQ